MFVLHTLPNLQCCLGRVCSKKDWNTAMVAIITPLKDKARPALE